MRRASARAYRAAAAGLLCLLAGCTATEAAGRSVSTTAAAVTSDATSSTSTTSTTSTTSGSNDSTTEVLQAVGSLAARRASALAAKDRSAWMTTVSDPADAFGVAQGALFDRLVLLPVSGLTARRLDVAPISTDGKPDASSRWAANLVLAYQLTGYDPGERTFHASYAVTRTSTGWGLAGVGPGQTDAQPFDLPDLQVLSSPTTLVVGNVTAATLRTYLRLGDAAHDRIAAVWGSAGAAVIVAPRSAEQLRTQLGRASDVGLDQVAGVTDGPLPTGQPAPADRVYLNPEPFARLSAAGRSVVITHELTHVTIRGSTTRAVPIWLSEGFADDVAFTGTSLPTRTIAADLLAKVHAGSVPSTLPSEADFNPTRGEIAPAYNEAWLAVLRMRQRYGQDKVVAFYRGVAGGPSLDPAVTVGPDALTTQAFASVLGTTQDAFVSDWVAYVKRLAG